MVPISLAVLTTILSSIDQNLIMKLIKVELSQILTDAALLKRQKLEIEELRVKLQVRIPDIFATFGVLTEIN